MKYNEGQAIDIDDLKKMGKIVKYKFIPESYEQSEIEEFFEKFILVRDGKELPKTSKNQDIFNYYFSLMLMLSFVRVDEFNAILNKLSKKLNISKEEINVFKSLMNEKSKEIFLEQVPKLEMKKDLLEDIYDIEKLTEELHKLMIIASEKGIDEFLKEDNFELREIGTIVGLIYIEKPFHYKNLVEILEEEKHLDKKLIDNFKNEILIPFSKKVFPDMPDDMKIEILNFGISKGIFKFTDFEAEVVIENVDKNFLN